MSQRAEYDELAEASEARLLQLVGESVLEGREAGEYKEVFDGLGARQTRSERLAAVGSAWFSRNREAIARAVCGNAELRRIFSSDPGTGVEIARAIGDAITSIGLLVPVPTLAMLITRKGLDWICGDDA